MDWKFSRTQDKTIAKLNYYLSKFSKHLVFKALDVFFLANKTISLTPENISATNVNAPHYQKLSHGFRTEPSASTIFSTSKILSYKHSNLASVIGWLKACIQLFFSIVLDLLSGLSDLAINLSAVKLQPIKGLRAISPHMLTLRTS